MGNNFKTNKIKRKITYIPCQHQKPAPMLDGRNVLICDFSYKYDQIMTMISQAKSFVILDHHKTAQAELEKVPVGTTELSEVVIIVADNLKSNEKYLLLEEGKKLEIKKLTVLKSGPLTISLKVNNKIFFEESQFKKEEGSVISKIPQRLREKKAKIKIKNPKKKGL